MRKLVEVFMIASIVFVTDGELQSQTKVRSEIPVDQTWNLADLYHSEASWTAAKEKLVSRFEEVLKFKGRLASSSANLLACLDMVSDIEKEFSRLRSYAQMMSDQDTRDAKALSMSQEVSQIRVSFASKVSFIEPEILAMDLKKIDQFMASEPKLEPHTMYLKDLQRLRPHRLSEKEEKIVAEAGLMADAPYTIYGIFSNAELPYPQIELSDGEKVLINLAGYNRYRTLPNRADREKVFQAFFGALASFQRTYGTQLYANIKRDMFYARVRNYESSLASSLDRPNIPVEVYHALVKNVNTNLPTFHRYLKLKQRMLGVETLKYSDLYAPVVKGLDLKYDYEEAKKLILEAMRPLGDDYVQVIKKALAERWIDVYPTEGKRSGAYSNGSAYDVHPYILMNYNGLYSQVSALAHELGHALHSSFSNKTQPYPKADYPIFVAEVASTLNEALLIDYMLKKINDDDVRLSLLMDYLDGIKGTVFRQTQFAEYELRIHEMSESGTSLTGDHFTKIYGEIVKKYYGHDAGVCQIDDLYAHEWAFIPHFYYNFYVYQYSTSYTASTALSEAILAREKGALEKYLAFISAGGSDYPINLLNKAGVDMTSPVPFEKTMSVMNRIMDEIESILDKKRN